MNLPAWTREPLVHFLVGGALVFALFSLRGGEVDPSSRVIAIDRETQAQIALGFERLMSRAPTDAELDAQIDRYVREEVLYREALRLGLDQDDAIVRRRLAQKMDMLASGRAETEQPAEATLRQWYADNSARFSDEASYSFDQLWFSTEDEARAAKARIGAARDWQALGERISLPVSLDDEPRREVLDRFGERFVAEIDALNVGDSWQGPIPSGLGWHLVRTRSREAGSVPPFEDVREDVENDWRSATIAERREQAYQILREAYRIEIE
ncbi:peptidylprolyl isomerase [Altererythrobacter arenosus]|uniref:peptidylprolyl isomerase n=1 Tax=Altererythrobacter arenosus TaxID=3032592 RepID=A0ABY8FMI2_9SPHN|nr:peptidylprolyl isomerase [Altererythrobacter sp. CAU 1644]WFL75982.1 peptidylprolyl isomerase [Altererythrobacter sp. CAU 1644]